MGKKDEFEMQVELEKIKHSNKIIELNHQYELEKELFKWRHSFEAELEAVSNMQQSLPALTPEQIQYLRMQGMISNLPTQDIPKDSLMSKHDVVPNSKYNKKTGGKEKW